MKAVFECGREFGVEKMKRGGEGGRDGAHRCQTLGKERRKEKKAMTSLCGQIGAVLVFFFDQILGNIFERPL
jgi:hypothetical protein